MGVEIGQVSARWAKRSPFRTRPPAVSLVAFCHRDSKAPRVALEKLF